jgi:hypothetical protein
MAKAKSVRKRTASSISPGQLISAEERERMIAETAYFRAMQRGFSSGDPRTTGGRREISRLSRPAAAKAEVPLTRAAHGLGKLLRREWYSKCQYRETGLGKATEELRKNGEHTADTINKITTSARKDMANAAQNGPGGVHREVGRLVYGVARPRQPAWCKRPPLLEWLQQAAIAEAADLPYRNVGRRVLECTTCGERIVLETTAHLPRCPKCKNMEFRRV